jgi:hypothetical protein
MVLPESWDQRERVKTLGGIVLVALVAFTPLLALAQAETSAQEMPRHPADLASQSIITLNSTTVAAYLVRLAEALSSNAHLLMARSTVVQSSKTLFQEAEDAINEGIVVSFAAARWSESSQAPRLLVSMPVGGNETVYYLDSIGVEAFILDIASAISRADYEAYLRASAAALKYYELLFRPSNAYTAPEGVMVGVPVIEALPSKECSWEINVTSTLLLTGGTEPGSETLLGLLEQWHYMTYPLLGEEAARECLKVRRTTIALVSSAYLNSYVELLAYTMALIASLQPLGPDMSEFVVVQVANYTVSHTTSKNAEQAIKLPFNSTTSSISSSGLRVIGDIERKLFHRGIPGSFMEPLPRGSGGNATISLGGRPGSWAVGVGSLAEALKGLGGVGLPGIPRFSSGSRLVLVGASRFLKVTVLGGFLVLAAYLSYREGVLRGLLRVIHRLRLALVMRASKISVPKGLPRPVQYYLYALRVASRLARPKEGWETPREYLNTVRNRLPFRARRVLEDATGIYEKYRYSRRKP